MIWGNTIVFKPAEDTPLCGLKMAEILSEAGLPNGVLNIVTGYGPEAGMPLIKHSKVGRVGFTGSREVGELVLREAGVGQPNS